MVPGVGFHDIIFWLILLPIEDGINMRLIGITSQKIFIFIVIILEISKFSYWRETVDVGT
jgi:hypothetical protein